MFFGTTVRGIAAVSTLFLFHAAASAQVLTVTPGVVLTAGDIAKVTYVNVALANQEVTIEVSGGFPIPQFHTIKIQLNALGVGSGEWTVANWRNAYFDAPGAAPVTLPIQ
jgi:hypothetical protein